MIDSEKRKVNSDKFLAKIALAIFVSALFYPSVSLGQELQLIQPQSYIVKFKNSGGIQKLKSIDPLARQEFTFSGAAPFQNIYSFNSRLTFAQLEQILGNSADYLEPNQAFQTQAIYLNDPGYTPSSLDIDKQWSLPKAGFIDAWEKSTGALSNVIAVIDTGIDGTHEDLQNINLVPGYNFIANQPITGRVNSDDNGHGTIIAGVLGASANNGKGIVGVNWSVSVMPIKALDAAGKGDASTISQALVWAVDHGANIINLSLGGIGFGHDTVLSDAVAYAFKQNAVIVAAAGNDTAVTGGNLDQDPVYPICDDNNANEIIGVAATDQNDLKPEFSNFGKNCIDVAAPGKRILSTINFDPLTKAPAPNSYVYASGTSMAVPFVAGEAALLKSLYPNASNAQIRDQIIATADQVDYLNLVQCGGQFCRGLLGSGRINAEKAVTTPLAGQWLAEGDLVKTGSSPLTYQIMGGQKRPISPFVYNQKFLGAFVKTITDQQLGDIQQGGYATPIEGTLFKLDASPTVYIMSNGQKLPITYQVFVQRKFNFSKVNVLSFTEVDSWVQGALLPPLEGTLVKAINNKTIYWVLNSVLHPVNYNFYVQRGLYLFAEMVVAGQDIASFPKGEAYIR